MNLLLLTQLYAPELKELIGGIECVDHVHTASIFNGEKRIVQLAGSHDGLVLIHVTSSQHWEEAHRISRIMVSRNMPYVVLDTSGEEGIFDYPGVLSFTRSYSEVKSVIEILHRAMSQIEQDGLEVDLDKVMQIIGEIGGNNK